MMASLDQSLRRLGLPYVDIFYHHRPYDETPLEETMLALADIVRSGKMLYAGISNYHGKKILRAQQIARELRLPLIINQVQCSMLNRGVEQHTLKPCAEAGQGIMVFSPLHQGLLTDRYLSGIPADSRAGKRINGLGSHVTPELVAKLNLLNGIAQQRGQSLAQFALSWVLRHREVTSVLIGASKPQQIIDNCAAAEKTAFTSQELAAIDAVLG